jgi:hypothetical protein
VISGNDRDGITLFDELGTEVMGNLIGLALDGITPVGNKSEGIDIQNSSNIHVGSADPQDRTVISANEAGVRVRTVIVPIGDCCAAPSGVAPAGTRVLGNYIGTDISGFAALGNFFEGVWIQNSPSNTIGGPAEGEGNLISGNGQNIRITEGSLNTVQGNVIGPDLDMLSSLGGENGISLTDAAGNLIGGDNPGEGNVLAGNETGVRIVEPLSQGNVIQGNLIGELPSGAPMGNDKYGIYLVNSGSNTIGGLEAGQGNRIANNGVGVAIQVGGLGSTRKAILSNNIYDNVGLGIDLDDDGVTLNDNMDPDEGANMHQNYPVVQSAEEDSGETTVMGSLNSLPNTGFRIQVFANTECDTSGFGEGEFYVGDELVTTDGSGDAGFEVTFPVALGGQYVTLTATDPDNNTSEFSECVPVSGGARSVQWGDLDCLGDVDESDAFDLILIIAGLSITFSPPCPGTGEVVMVDGISVAWGDWNCDDAVNSDDILPILSVPAGVPYEQGEPCPDIGEFVSVEIT